MARYTPVTHAKSMNSTVTVSEMSLHVRPSTHTLMVHRTFPAIGDIRRRPWPDKRKLIYPATASPFLDDN